MQRWQGKEGTALLLLLAAQVGLLLHHSFSLALGEPQVSAMGHPEIAGLLPPSSAEPGELLPPSLKLWVRFFFKI